jgi:hypothetical protein
MSGDRCRCGFLPAVFRADGNASNRTKMLRRGPPHPTPQSHHQAPPDGAHATGLPPGGGVGSGSARHPCCWRSPCSAPPKFCWRPISPASSTIFGTGLRNSGWKPFWLPLALIAAAFSFLPILGHSPPARCTPARSETMLPGLSPVCAGLVLPPPSRRGAGPGCGPPSLGAVIPPLPGPASVDLAWARCGPILVRP